MRLVTAVVRAHVVQDVIDALQTLGLPGGTVTEVSGYGAQKGHGEIYRGAEYDVVLVPKVRLELLVDDADVEAALATVLKTARTGRIGDGKVWVTEVLEVVRVRTGERGPAAI